MTLFDSPPPCLRKHDPKYFEELRNVNKLAAGRWAELIAPEDVTVQQIDDEFFDQYIDCEAYWHRALFELIMAAESSMKQECKQRKIFYPFYSPRELYNYLLYDDAKKKLTTKENLSHSHKISRLIKKCDKSNDPKKKRFYVNCIKDMSKIQHSFWYYLLFSVSSRPSSRTRIKNRWEFFLLALKQMNECLNIYTSRKTKQKQNKI